MSNASFLPEDYLDKQAERRTNTISLVLFVVVMGAVFGAFLVTNRQASQIKDAQASVNQQFKDAALKIEELNELESQKERMLHKAELATALLERVPRSILLAELINRMPDRLSLQEFQIKSTAVKKAPPKKNEAQTTSLSDRRKARKAERTPTREEVMEEPDRIEAPAYMVEIIMVGIAPTDLEVSNYIAQLNAYDLLRNVTLKYSIQVEMHERMMREFRVEMVLDPMADVRQISPLIIPRDLRNPLSDEMRFEIPAAMDPDDVAGMGDDLGNLSATAESDDEGGR
ncbi:MAG: PilN domain-containing protein [Phycisphaerales bacterium]